jgi:uncharacterized membrane protein YeaQ/YmgE (transglycosylase-associated protein family)
MDIISWLAWLIVGAVCGWLASLLLQGRMNLLGDIIFGIIGAVVGGVLYMLVIKPGATAFDFLSVVVAFVGAVILLGLVRLFVGRAEAL